MPNVPAYSARTKSIGNTGLTADVNADSAQIAQLTTFVNGLTFTANQFGAGSPAGSLVDVLLWLAANGGGTPAPTPLAAPTGLDLVPTSATTATLNFTAVTNNSGYTARIATDSAFTTGVQTVQVATNATAASFTGLTASTLYYSDVLTKGAGSYSNSARSAAVSDTTPGAGTQTLLFSSYDENAATFASDADHPAFSAFSSATVLHDHTTVVLKLWSNLVVAAPLETENNDGNVSPRGLGYVDGVAGNGYAEPVQNGISTVTLALPGSGDRNTKFINSYLQDYNSTGNYHGTCLLQATFSGGTHASRVSVPDKPIVLLRVHDSTGQYIQHTAPAEQAERFRALRPDATIKYMGAGGQQVSTFFDTPDHRAATAARWASAWGSCAHPQLLFGPDAINDWGHSVATGSTLGGYIGAQLTQTKTAYPHVRALVVSPYITDNEAGTAKLESVTALRAGVATAVSGRAAYGDYLNGATLTSAANLYNGAGVHPNNTGYLEGDAKQAAALAWLLNFETYNNAITSTAGISTTASTSGAYNVNSRIPRPSVNGQPVRLLMQRTTSSCGNVICGLHPAEAGVVNGAQIAFGMFLAPGTGYLTSAASGSFNGTGVSLALGDWAALEIAANGTVTLSTSPDKVNWTLAYTFSSPNSSIVTPVVSFYGDPSGTPSAVLGYAEAFGLVAV